jgi:LmbE family N-acetylglucosaminyl deacetylase
MQEQTNEHVPPKSALVIVAHPDDAELGCGGTVATWTAAGAEVWTCIVTDASGGGEDDAEDVGPAARQAMSELRKAEQRAACDALGEAGSIFLDYPDGRIEPSLDLRRDIVRVIRQTRPEIVITQSPDRRWDQLFLFRHHPDHLAVGQAVMSAVYPAARNSWDFPELLDEGLKPHRIAELWISAAPVLNHWVDVTAGLDGKIAALRAHHSQLGPRFTELEENIRKWMAETGAKYGVDAAEEFHRAVLR